VQCILLNLFIAVVLQGFSESNEDENLFIKKDQIEIFQNEWKKFDPNGTGYIGCNDFKTN
jgi:Ca2+-binding EF-hand superfamily protein